MNILISSVKIIDSNSPYHLSTVDVLIKNGTVSDIASSIEPQASYKQIKAPDLHISPAWFDAFVNFCDPGLEHKEDMETGLQAAIAGGFTAVGLLPNTQPVVDNKTQIAYMKLKAAASNAICEVHPIGANTKNLDNIHLAEMYEMYKAGAIAFSGGKKPIANTGVMLRSLQYVLPFNGIVVNMPEDKNLTDGAHLNEGFTSTQIGVKGKSNMSELLIIQRDIELARYTNSRVHFSQISTKEAVEAIAKAKKEGVKVTASVSPWHLAFTDSKLIDFNTNWKINPPLRSEKDKEALINGLKNGTIDFVSSFHQPQDEDCKKLEFDKADFGAIGLQTSYALLCQVGFSATEAVKMLSTNARSIFGLAVPQIKVGEKANFTLFHPKEKYILTEKIIHSKSKNTPLLNKELIGNVFGVINKGVLALNK